MFSSPNDAIALLTRLKFAKGPISSHPIVPHIGSRRATSPPPPGWNGGEKREKKLLISLRGGFYVSLTYMAATPRPPPDSGLWICIYFLRIRIQLFFSMRIRIHLQFSDKNAQNHKNHGAVNILIKCQLSPISLHFFSFFLTFFLKFFPPGSGFESAALPSWKEKKSCFSPLLEKHINGS